jgi:hypothetical protein
MSRASGNDAPSGAIEFPCPLRYTGDAVTAWRAASRTADNRFARGSRRQPKPVLEVDAGTATTEPHFVLNDPCPCIDNLIAASGAVST